LIIIFKKIDKCFKLVCESEPKHFVSVESERLDASKQDNVSDIKLDTAVQLGSVKHHRVGNVLACNLRLIGR
jgi:hypothetical protein